jgi:hypothetical protein
MYTHTLIATCSVYVLKNIKDLQTEGIEPNINTIVSFIAMIASVKLLNDATADNDDCSTRDVIVEKHDSASLLWIALFIGYASILTGFSARTPNTRPYLVLTYMIIFCMVFMMVAATNRHKSILMCPEKRVKVEYGEDYIEEYETENSSQCKEYIGIQCKSNMRKKGHGYFSIKHDEQGTTSTCRTHKKLFEGDIVEEDPDQAVKGAVYYESLQMDTAQKTFLLNASLTLLFASAGFMSPNFSVDSVFFVLIAVSQAAIFIYHNAQGTSDEWMQDSWLGLGTDKTTWSSASLPALLGLSLTFSLMSYANEFKHVESKPFFFKRVASILSGILFVIFFLVQISTSLSDVNPKLLNSGWGWDSLDSNVSLKFFTIAASICLFLFLLIPFSSRHNNETQGNNNGKRGRSLKSVIKFAILVLWLLCTFVFANNDLSISRTVRIGFLTLFSIMTVLLVLPKINSVHGGSGSKSLSIVLLLMSAFYSFNHFSNIDVSKESSQTAWYDINNASITLVFGITSLITSQITFGRAAFIPAATLCVVPFLTLFKYDQYSKQAATLDQSVDKCKMNLTVNKNGTEKTIAYSATDSNVTYDKITKIQMQDKDNHCQVLLKNQADDTIRYEFAPGCSCPETENPEDCDNSCDREINQENVSVSILEKCNLKVKYQSGTAKIKQEMLGVKGLILSDVHFQAEDASPTWTDEVTSIELSGANCQVVAYENENWTGARTSFGTGKNQINPPTRFGSLAVVQNDVPPNYIETLPFIAYKGDSALVNATWKISFYISLFAALISFATQGYKSQVGIFFASFVFSCLTSIMHHHGINQVGLGRDGLTSYDSESGKMNPNTIINLFVISLFFSLTNTRVFAPEELANESNGNKAIFVMVSLLFFVTSFFFASQSFLPIMLVGGIAGILVPKKTASDKLMSFSLPVISCAALMTAFFSANKSEGVGPPGGEDCTYLYGIHEETPQDDSNHAFLLQLGVVPANKPKRPFQKIVESVRQTSDEKIRKYCDEKDKKNPLCFMSRKNQCQFSYCINPPDEISMTNFEGEDKEKQQAVRCKSHMLFHTAALKAASEDRATSKQKYCLQYHKNDDCSNVCERHWRSVSDPVTQKSLDDMKNRLSVVDDSILNISSDEWVQMKREQLSEIK